VTQRQKLQVVTDEPRKMNGGHDPKAMGKKAVAQREANILADLTSTRQFLNAQARNAAEYIVGSFEDPGTAHPLGLAAAKDVLDRTVGKAAQELRVGPADQTMDILRELDP